MYAEVKTKENIYIYPKVKQKLSYKTKQKLMGIILIIISILMPIIFDGDATTSIFLLPLGFYLLITQKKVIY